MPEGHAEIYRMASGWHLNLRDDAQNVTVNVALSESQLKDIIRDSVKYVQADVPEKNQDWLYS